MTAAHSNPASGVLSPFTAQCTNASTGSDCHKTTPRRTSPSNGEQNNSSSRKPRIHQAHNQQSEREPPPSALRQRGNTPCSVSRGSSLRTLACQAYSLAPKHHMRMSQLSDALLSTSYLPAFSCLPLMSACKLEMLGAALTLARRPC